jgi:predicted RNA binding protein YcfA (HicA-like mRNA interferase family)
MPAFGPITRAKLVRFLRQLGFQGPYTGGKHQFMVKGQLRLRIPNPHRRSIGKNLLAAVLRQAGVSKAEWEKL